MKKAFFHTLLMALLAAGSPPTFAEITLVGSVGFGNATGSGDDADGDPATRTVGASELGAFTANGVDKLVVTIGGEGNNNGAESNVVTSVTYGGVPMTKVIDRYGGGNRGSSMWQLDDVAVTGDFVITFTQSQSGLGFAAYALNGTLPGPPDATASTTQNTVSAGYSADMTMNTIADGEFLIAALARNNFDNGGGQGIVAPLIELYYANTDGSSAASAYQFVPTAGTVTPTIYALTNGVGSVIAASFQPAAMVTSFRFVITPNVSPGLYDFEWNSQAGKVYDLLTSTDLSTPVDSWPVYDDGVTLYDNLPATGSTTTLSGVPSSAERRFFAIREEDAPPVPPLLSENFDEDNGGFTITKVAGTDWAWGGPASTGPGGSVTAGNGGGASKCWGTDIGTPGHYADPTTDSRLRSPRIDLTSVAAAELSFAHAIDIPEGDSAVVRIFDDVTDTEIVAGAFPLTVKDLNTSLADWEGMGPVSLPVGVPIRIEWCLTGTGGDSDDYMGWYVDDVAVVEVAP